MEDHQVKIKRKDVEFMVDSIDAAMDLIEELDGEVDVLTQVIENKDNYISALIAHLAEGLQVVTDLLSSQDEATSLLAQARDALGNLITDHIKVVQEKEAMERVLSALYLLTI